jgi:hypothetical protein
MDVMMTIAIQLTTRPSGSARVLPINKAGRFVLTPDSPLALALL